METTPDKGDVFARRTSCRVPRARLVPNGTAILNVIQPKSVPVPDFRRSPRAARSVALHSPPTRALVVLDVSPRTVPGLKTKE